MKPVGECVFGNECLGEASADDRDTASDRAADGRKNDALDEELTNDAQAAGAQGPTNSQLPCAEARAREHQVCCIGAGHD